MRIQLVPSSLTAIDDCVRGRTSSSRLRARLQFAQLQAELEKAQGEKK